MDFDTLSPGRLDEFRYAITTRAGYQSTRPPNFKPVVRTASLRPLEADGPTPDLGIIDARRLAPARRSTARAAEGRKVTLARTHSDRDA